MTLPTHPRIAIIGLGYVSRADPSCAAAQLAAYGITVSDLAGRKRATKGRKSQAAKPVKGVKGGKKAASAKAVKPRKPVAAKYRDPASKATWSGRGRVPRWLAAHETAGRKREEFAV